MSVQNIAGKQVTVNSARGEIRRTVVADLGDVLVLGTAEDYARSQTEGLDRLAIGFRRSDIINDEIHIDTEVCLKHNIQYEQAEHGQASANRSDVERGKQPPRDHPDDGRVD